MNIIQVQAFILWSFVPPISKLIFLSTTIAFTLPKRGIFNLYRFSPNVHISSSPSFTENLQRNEDYFPAHAWDDIYFLHTQILIAECMPCICKMERDFIDTASHSYAVVNKLFLKQFVYFIPIRVLMSVILKIYLILIYKIKSTNKKWWHLTKNPYNIFILPRHKFCQIFAFVWNFCFYLNGIIQDHTSCRSSQECYISLA